MLRLRAQELRFSQRLIKHLENSNVSYGHLTRGQAWTDCWRFQCWIAAGIQCCYPVLLGLIVHQLVAEHQSLSWSPPSALASLPGHSVPGIGASKVGKGEEASAILDVSICSEHCPTIPVPCAATSPSFQHEWDKETGIFGIGEATPKWKSKEQMMLGGALHVKILLTLTEL